MARQSFGLDDAEKDFLDRAIILRDIRRLIIINGQTMAQI